MLINMRLQSLIYTYGFTSDLSLKLGLKPLWFSIIFCLFLFLDLSILIRFSILLNPPLPKKKKTKLISCNSRVEVDIQFEYKLNK